MEVESQVFLKVGQTNQVAAEVSFIYTLEGQGD